MRKPLGYTISIYPCNNSVAMHVVLDLAEWLERLTANAEVATVLGSGPSILRHSGI